jgi:hypothetical protein
MKRHNLTPEGREVIMPSSDADDSWYVFSESPAIRAKGGDAMAQD